MLLRDNVNKVLLLSMNWRDFVFVVFVHVCMLYVLGSLRLVSFYYIAIK